MIDTEEITIDMIDTVAISIDVIDTEVISIDIIQSLEKSAQAIRLENITAFTQLTARGGNPHILRIAPKTRNPSL